MSLDHAFVGIENASSTEKLPHLNPGKYTLEVQALKYIPNSRKGPLSIGEFTIVEAIGEGANQVGTSASHVIKMSLDSALGNVKNMVASVIAKAENAVTRQDTIEVFGKDNPTRGIKVRADVFTTKTKAGNDFSLVKYAPFAGVTTATPIPMAAVTTSTAPKAARKA